MPEYDDAARVIRERLEGIQPRIGLVLGSGLGAVADKIEEAVGVPYSDLPGFPQPTIEGHAGRLVVGKLNGIAVACLQGRSHAYEGHAPARIAVPVRTLNALGCKTLLLTNAAGSLHRTMVPGTLMAITDHINWSGINPLIGPNDEALGPRFVDMTESYDPEIRMRLHEAAAEADTELFDGVYVMVCGPNFETPAEIRAFGKLGGDAVGMSTVPEVLAARHCGMKVGAVSLITNFGAGLARHKLNHEEVLEAGMQAAGKLARLITHCLPKLAG